MSLQKTCIKPLDSYGFILQSLYKFFEASEFWGSKLSIEQQKSLREKKNLHLCSEN
jgi:hypothetical protein